MRLISCLGRSLANEIDKVHTGHPLIVGQLNLSRKIVNMSNQAAENLAISRRHIGAHSLEDMAGEVGVEPAARLSRVTIGAVGVTVGSHCERCGCRWKYNTEKDTISLKLTSVKSYRFNTLSDKL